MRTLELSGVFSVHSISLKDSDRWLLDKQYTVAVPVLQQMGLIRPVKFVSEKQPDGGVTVGYYEVVQAGTYQVQYNRYYDTYFVIRLSI